MGDTLNRDEFIIRESNDVLQELESVNAESAVDRYTREARTQIQLLRDILWNMNNEDSRNISSQVDSIESDVNEYSRDGNLPGLERCLDRLQQLYLALATQTIEFWQMNFEVICSQANKASDYYRFEDLRQQGVRAYNSGNVETLRNICSQMWELLPHQEGEMFDSSLSGVTK